MTEVNDQQPAPENAVEGEKTPQSEQVEQSAKPQPEPKKFDFGRNFSSLSRKERELRAREESLKAREEQARSGGDPEMLRLQAKANPLKFLEDHGLSIDQIAQIAADDGQTGPESEIFSLVAQQKSMIQELKDELKELKSGREQDQQQSHEQEFIKGMVDHIESDSETYKAIIANDAYETVFRLIEADYNHKVEQGNESPQAMSYDEAAKQVEDYLREQTKAQAQKLGFYTPAEQDSDSGESSKANPSGSTFSQTLSNEQSRQTPTPGKSPNLDNEAALREIAKKYNF